MASSSLAGGLMTQPVQFVTPVDDALDFDANGTKLTASQDYFHKIYDIQMGEKGNLDVRDREQNDIIIAQEKEEKDDDFKDMLVDQAMAEMKRIRLGGLDLTAEEFKAVNERISEEIANDPQKFAEENGLSLAEVAMMQEMTDWTKENEWNEEKFRQKFGEENIAMYIKVSGDVDKKIKMEQSMGAGTAIKNANALNDESTREGKVNFVNEDTWSVSTQQAATENADVIAEVKGERTELGEADKNSWLSDTSDSTVGSFAELQANGGGAGLSILDSFSNATAPLSGADTALASTNDMKNAFGLG
jgi:hypothetical protein